MVSGIHWETWTVSPSEKGSWPYVIVVVFLLWYRQKNLDPECPGHELENCPCWGRNGKCLRPGSLASRSFITRCICSLSQGLLFSWMWLNSGEKEKHAFLSAMMKTSFPKWNVFLLSYCFCCFPWKHLFNLDKKQFLFSCQASKVSLRNASAFLISGGKSAWHWGHCGTISAASTGRWLEEQQSETYTILCECTCIRRVCLDSSYCVFGYI